MPLPRLRRRNQMPADGLVGTEAAAAKSLQSNARNFKYPTAGFLTPVEHTLLYNMLSAPHVFPVSAMKETIEAEDFSEYLLTKQVLDKNSKEPPEYVCSSAQLTALLALAAEKWPPPENKDSEPSIPQILCKKLINTVVRHAAEHDLDRELKVQELLQPLEALKEEQGGATFVALVLPTYIGYGMSIATANPLPVLIGSMATQMLSARVIVKEQQENSNMSDLQNTTKRMADVETTSLLDEEY